MAYKGAQGYKIKYKKAHRSAYSVLKEFGKIVYYSDLTFANIRLFDDWLHNNDIKQTTIYGRYKILKSYINEAIRFGKIDINPYKNSK